MMMSLLPNGILGLTFAALVAAIVSSLASMTNSVSTIFTMDIYRSFVRTKPSEQKLVNVGRNMAWIISNCCALRPAIAWQHGISISVHSKFHRLLYTRHFGNLFSCLILEKGYDFKRTCCSYYVLNFVFVYISCFPRISFYSRMGVVFLISGFACYLTSLLQGYDDQEKQLIYQALILKPKVHLI